MPRMSVILLLLALCALASGCGLALQAAHVAGYRVHETVEDCKEWKRNRVWAEMVWSQIVARHPREGFSPEYAEGFKSGFAEYLFYGGDGLSPRLPPQEYRSVEYQTPAGYLAIQQWYAGYAHGSTVADSGGFRRLVTGPPPPDYVSGPGPFDAPCLPTPQAGGDAAEPAPMPTPAVAGTGYYPSQWRLDPGPR